VGGLPLVLLSRASGCVGSVSRPALTAAGHEARRLVRRPPEAPEEVQWQPQAGVLPAEAMEDVSVVINLSGAGVGDRRWTRRRRHELIASRTAPTKVLARAVAATWRQPVAVIDPS